ncbi:MAG: hypothetical protein R3B70_05330 [Polyangiaceae bacterium]
MERPTLRTPTDFAFKRIRPEQHKDVLVAFLNDMLDRTRRTASSRSSCFHRSRPPVAELKLSIVDVKCTDARGHVRGRDAGAPGRGVQARRTTSRW